MPTDNQYGAPFVKQPDYYQLPKINTPSGGASPGDPSVTGRSAGPETAEQRFARLEGKRMADTGINPSDRTVAELGSDLSGRYEKIIPGANNEDMHAQNQSFGDKVVSGVGKGLLLTGTTFLQSTAGLVNGVVNSIHDGRLASFYDNDFNRELDAINKKAEDLLPNYYTDVEKNARWYSSDKLMTGNFIFDGIVKNMGFAAGAALAGGVYGAGLKALPLTARLFSVGKGAEAAIATEEAMLSANKVASTYGKIKDLSSQFLSNYNNLTTGGRAVVAGLSTTGEAGFEAYQNLNTFRDKKIEEFKNNNDGLDPVGVDLEKINKLADSVGNSSFAYNVALLSATNYIQFPTILGSSFKGESSLLEGMRKNVGGVIQDAAGKWSSVAAARSTSQSILRGITKVPGALFSASEGFEEGAQYAIQMGTQDYYNKKYNGKRADVLQSVGEGVRQTLTTDEGLSNILVGGISGSLMMAKGHIEEHSKKNKNTVALVKGLNENPFSKFTSATADAIVRGTTLQEERAALLAQGDKFGSKNVEADSTINYLMPRIKFGRMDLVQADINDYVALASTEKGFNELKEEGKVLENEDRLAFINRVERFSTTAKTMESLYQSLNLRYGNKVNESGKRLYTDDIIEKMMYSGSKIDDFTGRILSTSPLTYGADVEGIISSTIAGNDDAYNQALADIDANTILAPEQKTNAKEAIDDIAKMGIFRDMYTKEYLAYRENPQTYQEKDTDQKELETIKLLTGNGDVTPENIKSKTKVDENGNVVPVETVSIKTFDGQEDLEIGEEYFLGRTFGKSAKGHDVYFFPRLTILGENPDGTIRIKDNNGERNVAPDVLEKYKLGKVSDTMNNKKAKFYMDNVNTPFFFNFGKEKEGKEESGKVPGRLQYNQKDGVLDFVYLSKRTGKEKVIEVTREQFAPGKIPNTEKTYKEAIITAGTPMTLAQKSVFDEFIEDKTDDPRITLKNEKRLKVLDELMTDLNKRQEKFSNLIETKQASIASMKEDLAKLEKQIAVPDIDKRSTKTIKFKAATKRAIEAATKLSSTQRQLEDEVTVLETQLEEIEMTQTQVQGVIDNIDLYPSNSSEFLEELKMEAEILEDLHKSNSSLLRELSTLLKATQRALDSAIDFLHSMITSFEKKYPNVPRIMGQDWVDFLKDNPNFLKLNPDYKTDLSTVDEAIANIETETIEPNQHRLDVLQEHLSLINNSLAELEKQIKAKKIIAKRFDSILEKYHLAEEEAVKTSNIGVNKDDLKVVMNTSVPTNEAYIESEDYEAASKKAATDVVTSTVASQKAIDEKIPHALRAQRFGNRFNQIKRTVKIKGQLVTANTEAKILPGLMTHMFPTGKQEDHANMIVMVMTDEKGNLLDENGKVIQKNDSDVLNKAIYQAFPTAHLKQMYSGGMETMFRENTPKVERDRLTENFKQWRFNLLQKEELTPRREVAASFGHPEEVDGDPEARTDVQSAGIMTTDMLLDREVLAIATNSTTLTNGSFSLKTELGRVFLSLPNVLVKLYNRKFTSTESLVIYEALHKLSQHAQIEDGLKNATNLIDWLKSTIYLGFDKEVVSEGRKDPNKNNVWFSEDPGTGELLLNVGSLNFPFTPQTLKTNNQFIVGALQGMYGNTHAAYTRKSLNNTYSEIKGFDDEGNPIYQEWPNYQSYLLSDKLPDSDGLLTLHRDPQDIPLRTKIRPLISKEDTNRSRIYFTMVDSIDDIVQNDKASIPEPVVKTTVEGKKEVSIGYTLDGVTLNSMPIGAIGHADFTLDNTTALPILSKYGADVLAPENIDKLANFIGELFSKNILKIEPINSDVTNQLIKNKIAIDAQGAADVVSGFVGQSVTQVLVPMLINEKSKEIVPATVVEKEPVALKPTPVLAPAKPVVSTGYDLTGNGENIFKFQQKTDIPFKINGTQINAILEEDPTAFDTPVKRLEKVEDLLTSGAITISFTEENAIYFTQSNLELKNSGKKELSSQDINTMTAYGILTKALPQIEAEMKAPQAEEVVDNIEAIIKASTTEPPVAENPITAPTANATDIIIGNPTGRRRRGVNRLRVESQLEQFGEEVWESLTPELTAMLPNLPVYRVKNIIQATNGRQAWGMFRDGAIYIYKNAEAGTGYHEVFEAVWAMFTDSKERGELVKEFRSRPGTFKEYSSMREIKHSEATYEEAKEEMAEEFRRFILDKNAVKEKSLLRRLFDHMVDFFNNFFFGPKSISNTQQLFDRIGNGYYAQYNPYESALSIAKKGVLDIDEVTGREGDEYRIKGLSAKIENELFQHMTYAVIDNLIKEGKSFFSLTKKMKSADIYDPLYEEILGNVETNTPGIIDELAMDYIYNIEDGVDVDVSTKKVAELRALKNVIHQSWSQIIKQHKQYLKPYEITFDENDDVVDNDDNRDGSGDYMSSNKVDAFKKANASIKLLFATIPDTEMFDGELSLKPSSINGATFMGTDKVFINLMNELHDSVNITDMLEKLEMLAQVNQNYGTVYKRLLRRNANTGESINEAILLEDDMRLVTAFWQTLKKQNPDVLTVYNRAGGEAVVGNTSLTNAAKQSREEMTQAIIRTIREGNKYFSYDEDKKVFNPTTLLKNLDLDTSSAEAAVTFLKEFGIDFNASVIEGWKRSDKDTARTAFINRTKGLVSDFKKMKDIKFLSSSTLDAKSNLLGLGTIAAMIKMPIFESVYYNMEKEKVQSFIGVNYASSFYDNFSKINHFDALANTPFRYLVSDVFSNGGETLTRSSVILNKVFNPMSGIRKENTDNIMKVVYINGSINDDTGKATPTSQMSYSERLAQEINLNLDGTYLNLVPGDAELEWGLRLHEKDSPLVSLEEVKKGAYQTIFKNYFISEMKLAREKRPVAKGRVSTDLRFFKEILGDALHALVIKEKGTAEEIYVSPEFNKKIQDAVESFLNTATNESKELLSHYNLITKQVTGSYVTTLGFKDKFMEETQMEDELKKLTVNYIIANIEMHKLLYSDPYQYSDELKRIKNYNSPRQSLADSPEINQLIHDIYNKGYDVNDLGYSKMNRSSFRTVTLGDVESVHDDLIGLDGYTGKGGSWEETDGGGYISPKAKRLFDIKTSNWTEANERQYRHDITYEEIVDKLEAAKSYEEQKKYEIELSNHEKNNPGVKSTYTPTKPIVSGSKDNGREYNDQVLDKYALFTLSFRLLHKMNPNSDAIKLYRKMARENIDYAVFGTGRKVGKELVSLLYVDGKFNEEPFESPEQKAAIAENKISYKELRAITNIPFSIVGLQTEVPSKDTHSVTQGSQITKLATMDYLQAGVPIDYVPTGGSDKVPTFEDVFIGWMKLSEEQKKEQSPLYKEIVHNKELLEARIENGYKDVLDSLGIKESDQGYVIGDREKMISTLENEISKQEVNNNLLEAFESFRKQGSTIILEATPAYQQIRNTLYSIASHRITRPKITGGQKVQMPSTLLLDSGRKVIKLEKNGKEYLASDSLAFYTKGENGAQTNVCEIMVARWFDSSMNDTELLKYLNTTDEGKALLRGIAFRIPTQKQNSIDAFKIKQFLPKEYGDAVVIPSALVKKSGSDFDIDKLSIYLKNLYHDSNNKLRAIPYFGIGEAAINKFKELYDSGEFNNYVKGVKDALSLGNAEDRLIESMFPAEYSLQREDIVFSLYGKSIDNEYISSLENLVLHPSNFDNLIKPNSAEEMKVIANELNKLKGIPKTDYSSPGFMLSRQKMSGLRDAFVRGKKAIGIAAVGQTNNAQNQRSAIFLDIDKLTGENFDTDTLKRLDDGQIKFADGVYNTIEVNGKIVPTLSKIKNSAGKYISDIIGMFIDGYVDIAKGPWIMEMGATPATAGTWLFLVKLGVPIDTVAYFMNQPVIQDLLREANTSGVSIYNKNLVTSIEVRYDAVLDKNLVIPSNKELIDMIDIKTVLSPEQESYQVFMLHEFLKYSEMATQLFDVTQGTNSDTANINDPFLMFKKVEQLKIARKNMLSALDVVDGAPVVISAADSNLKNSFVGELNDTLLKIKNAYADTILLSDKPRLRKVLEKVLLPFVKKSDRAFVTISQKVVSDLFDWAVQTDRNFNKSIKRTMLGTTSEKSAAKQIIEFKENIFGSVDKNIAPDTDHPLYGNYVLDAIEFLPGGKENVADNIRIKAETKVYDQNRIINSFDEIKEYLLQNGPTDLYGKIVRLAVMQSGLSTSKISFSRLLPYKDFKEIYNATLSKLEDMEGLENFEELNVFQRNSYNNTDIVPIVKLEPEYTWEGHLTSSKLESQVPKVLKDAMEYKLVPKIIAVAYGPDVIKATWMEKVSEEEMVRRQKTGDSSHFKSQLMRKVYRDKENNIPLIHSWLRASAKGKEKANLKPADYEQRFVYVAINAWGDSFRAKEYYDYVTIDNDGTPDKSVPPSIFDNGVLKVQREYVDGKLVAAPEVTDDFIVSLYEGGTIDHSISSVIPVINNTTIAENIYKQLPTKSIAGNVKFMVWKELKEIKTPINGDQIVSTRLPGNYSFGNPFSSDQKVLMANPFLIETQNTKESVVNYIDWILTGNLASKGNMELRQEVIEEKLGRQLSVGELARLITFENDLAVQREYILEQLKSGELKDKEILYWANFPEASHANALDHLINRYDWDIMEKLVSKKTEIVNDNTNKAVTVPKAEVLLPKENISSRGSEFAKQLSNIGNTSGVFYRGKYFRNSEHAYQTWKSGTFDPKAYASTASKPIGIKPVNTTTNYQTMVEILKAKLEQHKELRDGLAARGGMTYLEKSTHNVDGKDLYWETKGEDKFMQALREAYALVTKNTVTLSPETNDVSPYSDISEEEWNSYTEEEKKTIKWQRKNC